MAAYIKRLKLCNNNIYTHFLNYIYILYYTILYACVIVRVCIFAVKIHTYIYIYIVKKNKHLSMIRCKLAVTTNYH